MKNVLLILLMISCQIRVFGMMEAEWGDKTPFNGYMYYYEDVTNGIKYSITSKLSVDNVKIWYFYNRCTIGEMEVDSLGNRYYVGNEISGKLELFTNKEEWQLYLKNNNLNPFIVRWYNDSWSMFPKVNNDFGLGLFTFLSNLIRIFVVSIIIAIIYNRVQGKSILKLFKFLFLSIYVVFYFFKFLLGEFPQSI